MSIQVDPIRRNLQFGLPKGKALSWNPAGLHITQFYNTLSIFFPAGERFFIQSVRNYRDQLTEPPLKEQISAFIGQEGFHTREHEEYNDALRQAGLPVEQMERVVVNFLEAAKKLPKPLQLAATIALEHLTAVLGDTLLRDDDLLDGADPRYAAIWRWQARYPASRCAGVARFFPPRLPSVDARQSRIPQSGRGADAGSGRLPDGTGGLRAIQNNSELSVSGEFP